MQTVSTPGQKGNAGFVIFKREMKLAAPGFRVEFVARNADQGFEGSCTAQAMMRCLLVTQYGMDGATTPFEKEKHLEYVVVASRLVSMFRSKADTATKAAYAKKSSRR
jgi:hypothetical protein